ncbi:hypothetical protein N9137_02255 [Pseudomonadales bacterium]|nr:hypothetical protein [Pseudomonadales bacterium]MDB4431191.1 hypothetical protein [Pseudomonadales bacterium]
MKTSTLNAQDLNWEYTTSESNWNWEFAIIEDDQLVENNDNDAIE